MDFILDLELTNPERNWIEHEKNEMLFFRMDGREVMGGLPAESNYRLQKVGGEVLGMLN